MTKSKLLFSWSSPHLETSNLRMDEVSPTAGLKHLFFQKHGENHRFSEVLKDAPWSPSAVKTNYRNYRSVSLTQLLSNNQAGLFRQCLKHVLKATASTNGKYLYSRYYVPDPRTVLLLLLSPLFTEAQRGWITAQSPHHTSNSSSRIQTGCKLITKQLLCKSVAPTLSLGH